MNEEERISSGVARGRLQNRGRGEYKERHRALPDETRATIVEHVMNRGLTMAARLVTECSHMSTVLQCLQLYERVCRDNRHSINKVLKS